MSETLSSIHPLQPTDMRSSRDHPSVALRAVPNAGNLVYIRSCLKDAVRVLMSMAVFAPMPPFRLISKKNNASVFRPILD